LRDGAQRTPKDPTAYRLSYRFADDVVQIRARIEGGAGEARLIVPIVCGRDEAASRADERTLAIAKARAAVRVSAGRALQAAPEERVFNPVPGLEAVPVKVDVVRDEETVLEIRVVAS
jgi:hypothetical protein